jgi:hypothetical protein
MSDRMVEIVEDIKIVKLNGLKRRLLLILYNNERFMNSSKIRELLMRQYRRGEIDNPYSFNYVCINLRELYDMGFLDKRKINHSFGKTSLYAINNYGKEQLMINLQTKKSDNNNCVVVEGE